MKNPKDPNPKKKVYGDPIYGPDQDITNRGKKLPLEEEIKGESTEPLDNYLNTAEQAFKTNKESADNEETE